MLKFFSINTTVESICFLLSLYYLRKEKSRFWIIFSLYLGLTCFIEISGNIIGKVYHQHNIWLYNIFMLIEALFICYGLYFFLKDYLKITIWMLSTLCIILIINTIWVFKNGIGTYNDLTVSIMSVVFVLYALIYFYVLLRDEAYIDLKNHPAFWWVGGMLIFYFGSTLANFFDDLFAIKVYGKYSLRFFAYSTLNIFLYSFWTYSFICRARQHKLSH